MNTENEVVAEAHTDETRLFTHTRCPEWGLALLTYEGNGRRRYQFQDGNLRTFKEGFYHLMKPVDDAETSLLQDLERKHDLAVAHRQEKRANPVRPPVMSFKDQLRVFKSMYPGGFQDAEYVDTWRDRPGNRRLKRLVDPVIEQARGLLSRKALEERIEAEDWAGVHADMIAVLRSTGLASPSEVVDPLEKMDPEHHPRLARALQALLWGEDKYGARFREWVIALSAEGTIRVRWSMVTLLPALVHPDQHVCVQRKAFRLQARSIDPDAVLPENPTPAGYKAALRIARKLKRRLERQEMPPFDLFDVRCFAWQTLRPRGVEILESLDRPIV